MPGSYLAFFGSFLPPFTVSTLSQDGKAAGQSVPHVHFHVLPRRLHGDHFAENDDVYPALDHAEGSLGHRPLHATERQPPALRVDADEDRVARGIEEMAKEADWLKGFFDS
jgi:bis(5'-adenosyl)-triphosphatase